MKGQNCFVLFSSIYSFFQENKNANLPFAVNLILNFSKLRKCEKYCVSTLRKKKKEEEEQNVVYTCQFFYLKSVRKIDSHQAGKNQILMSKPPIFVCSFVRYFFPI